MSDQLVNQSTAPIYPKVYRGDTVTIWHRGKEYTGIVTYADNPMLDREGHLFVGYTLDWNIQIDCDGSPMYWKSRSDGGRLVYVHSPERATDWEYRATNDSDDWQWVIVAPVAPVAPIATAPELPTVAPIAPVATAPELPSITNPYVTMTICDGSPDDSAISVAIPPHRHYMDQVPYGEPLPDCPPAPIVAPSFLDILTVGQLQEIAAQYEYWTDQLAMITAPDGIAICDLDRAELCSLWIVAIEGICNL